MSLSKDYLQKQTEVRSFKAYLKLFPYSYQTRSRSVRFFKKLYLTIERNQYQMLQVTRGWGEYKDNPAATMSSETMGNRSMPLLQIQN